MPDTCLDARGISKRYGAVTALAEVDITARPGDVHGLLGANGAGKTTLLRVLLGLVAPDAGSVRLLDGEPDAHGALPAAVAGFVETPSFYPYLSARANLVLLDRLDGHARWDRTQRIGAALAQAGLVGDADTEVGRYSSGMRQRLGLASALLRRPRLLLLDEPTSAIDPAGARDVCALLQGLAHDGAAVMFSCHDLDLVEQACTTISVLDRGRLIFSGTIADLRGAAEPRHRLRTSDDEWALRIAATVAGVRAERGEDGSLAVFADERALDRYVIALGCNGIAVRQLERRARTLESLFLEEPAASRLTKVAS